MPSRQRDGTSLTLALRVALNYIMAINPANPARPCYAGDIRLMKRASNRFNRFPMSSEKLALNSVELGGVLGDGVILPLAGRMIGRIDTAVA